MLILFPLDKWGGNDIVCCEEVHLCQSPPDTELQALSGVWTALARRDRGRAAIGTEELETSHVLTVGFWWS